MVTSRPSLSGIVRTLGELTETCVMINSLREGIDYSTPTGRMVAGIFAALAEYEHSLINERAEAARARGKQTGRPRSLTPAQTRQPFWEGPHARGGLVDNRRARRAARNRPASRVGAGAGWSRSVHGRIVLGMLGTSPSVHPLREHGGGSQVAA